MEIKEEIKAIVHAAIPLDMNCAVVRSEQLKRRAKLQVDIFWLINKKISESKHISVS